MGVPTKEDLDVLKFIKSWEPQSDVRAFTLGGMILAGSTAISAGYINYRFRRALKMRNFALLTTYAAVVLIPTVLSPALHVMIAVTPILMGQQKCPVCIETRSAFIQAGTGLVYPLLLAPIACLQFAGSYMTVAVPSFKNYKPLLSMLASIVRPIRTPLLSIAAAQMVLGGMVSHWEQSNLIGIMEKLNEMEKSVPEHKKQMIRDKLSEEEKSPVAERRPEIPKYAFGIFEE